MQDKTAKKSAREVNRFLQPELVDTTDYEKKIGRAIPKSKRDLSSILKYQDQIMRKEDPTLPSEISATHLMVVKKLSAIAFRENLVDQEIECPSCGEKVPVQIVNSKNEQNSVKALECLSDRMFPKLASLTHEVNISGQINVLAEKLSAVVVKYVPAEKRMLCLGEIYDLIEKVSNNQNDTKQIESDNGELSVTVA